VCIEDKRERTTTTKNNNHDTMASLDHDDIDEEREYEVVDVKQRCVKLVSRQGHEFICDRDAVMASGSIRAMLTGAGVWKEQVRTRVCVCVCV
jgi:hypothetical protein